MWVYLFIGIVFIYIVYKERQALGCGNFFEGKDCNNAKGKAVCGSSPEEDDSIAKLLDRIDYASDYHSRYVKWRSFLIVSLLTMLLLWFILFREMPGEWELVVGILILFVAFSSITNFYKFHLYSHIEKNINTSTELIRRQLQLESNVSDIVCPTQKSETADI